MSELVTTVVHGVDHEVHRTDFWIRVIIVLRLIKSTLLVALAITAFALAHSDVHHSVSALVSWLGFNPLGPRISHVLGHLVGLTPLRIEEVALGALVITAAMLVEAWGLHTRKGWGEWLSIGITSSLIPLEIYEVVHRASAGKVMTLIANIAIVVYLAGRRSLATHGRLGRWIRAHVSK